MLSRVCWSSCWILAELAVLGLVGCSGSADTPRELGIEGGLPDLIERGGRFSIRGQGFPGGNGGHVLLDGRMLRPAQPPKRVRVRLPVRAASSDRLLTVVDGRAYRDLGGRGTFRGSLRVSFRGHDGRVDAAGSLEAIRFDLSAPVDDSLAEHDALRGRARALLAFVGVVVDDTAASHAGVQVDWARPGSHAARAGLSHGDTIVEAGGVGIHTLGDLAPAPGMATLALRVRRPGRAAPIGVTISLQGFHPPAADARLWSSAAAAIFTLLCAVLLGPLPSLTPFLARCRSRMRMVGSVSLLRVWDQHPIAGIARSGGSAFARLGQFARDALLPIAIGAALFAFAFSERTVGLPFHTLSLCLGLAALGPGITLLITPGLPWSRRRARARKQFTRTGVVAVAVIVAFVQSGTRDLEGVVSAQGGAPWCFGVFANPALLILLPAFLVHGGRAHATDLGSGRVARGLAFAIDASTRGVICALAAAVFLGGWEVRGLVAAHHDALPLLGPSLFVLKVWLVAWLLATARSIELGLATRPWLPWLLCSISLGVSVALATLGVGPRHTLVVGVVSFTVAVILSVTAVIAIRRSSRPLSPEPSHPALAVGG